MKKIVKKLLPIKAAKDSVELVTKSEIMASAADDDSLKSEIYEAAKEIMMEPEFGFPEDEIDDYLFVEVVPDGSRTRVEVRAELSYRGMREVAERLDEILKKYDPDAYFDDVDSGIIDAYIENKDAVDGSIYDEIAEMADSVVSADDLARVVRKLKSFNKGYADDVRFAWSTREYNPTQLGKMIAQDVRDMKPRRAR